MGRELSEFFVFSSSPCFGSLHSQKKGREKALTELTSCASPASTAPAPSGALYWKTGSCCRMWCLTAETSAVRTQYFVVDRTKPCEASSFLTPEASPRRAE